MNKGSFKQRMTSYVHELVNPISYYDWINQNTTIQGIPFTCDRYPFQKAIINDMSQELHCIKPSQIGLALELSTPIPTPNGWTIMGDVQVGDTIYAPDGSHTKVTFKSEIYTDHKCYKVVFNDGTEIIADENHRWFVESQYSFKLKGLSKSNNQGGFFSGVVNTGEMQPHVKHNGRNSFRIKNTEPLQNKEVSLNVDPYVFGLWLGDGNAHTGYISVNNMDIPELQLKLESKNYAVKVNPDSAEGSYLVIYDAKGNTLISNILTMGVVKGVKSVPKEFLRGSKQQRLELLQGLMDSDGNVEKNGSCVFSNTNLKILETFQEVAHSLGLKTNLTFRKPHSSTLKSGKVITSTKDMGVIRFTAHNNTPISALVRKVERLKDSKQLCTKYQNYRHIVDIIEVEPVPVQCLTVDHPTHLFLCSKAMIPTHNTEVQLRKALAYVSRNPHRNLIYTMPDENMRKRVFQNRVLPLLTQDSVFHGLNAAGKKPIRSIEITEINNSQMLMFPANEKAATSQPADVVFNDEIDLSDPQIIALFNSRLQGSDVKINHNYSTPTFQGIGIDALYETSDQHEYMFKCPHCGFYQLPEFTSKFIYIPGLPAEAPDDLSKFEPQWLDKYGINTLDARSVCCKCGKQVTYGDEENHKWVPRHPHRSNSRGYRISPFSTRNLDATYVFNTLMKYIRGDNMKGFQNTVLGKTHESSDERLSESLLRALFTPNFDPIFDHNITDPFFIGIDMGKICHVSIGFASSVTNVKTVLFETVKAEELEARLPFYFSKFNIKMGFIDRLPLITTSEAVRDKTNKVIMPMQYELTSGGQMVGAKTDEYGNLSYVAAHRTMHLDRLASALRSGFVEFSGYGSQKDSIIQHLRAMVREIKSDNSGTEKVPMWVKKDKNDHYFHSLGYLYQAIIQYYNGCSFLEDEGYNSSIYLGGMDNFIVPNNSISLLGRN